MKRNKMNLAAEGVNNSGQKMASQITDDQYCSEKTILSGSSETNLVLKICSKFTGEHPCRSVISLRLLCNFSEISLRHGCLLHIFGTPFP